VELLRHNIHLNNLTNVQASKLLWDNDTSISALRDQFPIPFDTVVAMEVIYNESHVPLVLNTVRKLLVTGGEFLLGFVGRRVLNASAVLPQLYSMAEKFGFVQIPLQYNLSHNSAIAANFKFSTFIAWKVPPYSTIITPQETKTKISDEDEEFLKLLQDPTVLTDTE